MSLTKTDILAGYDLVLRLQNGLQPIIGEDRLAEHLTSGLAGLPGVTGCALTLDDGRSWSNPPAAGPESPVARAFELRTNGALYGALTVHFSDAEGLARFEALLKNTADRAALHIENGRQARRVASLIGRISMQDEDRGIEQRLSEVRYRQFVENANSIMLSLDVSGTVLFFNSFAERFLGFSADEVVGRKVWETVVPERDRAGHDLREMIADLCQDPQRYTVNVNENVCKNGERVWVAWTNSAIRNAAGRVTEVLCVGNDLSSERNAYAALREQEERLRAIFESAQDAVFMKDRELRYTHANPAMLALLRRREDQVIGQPNEALFKGEALRIIDDQDQRVLEGESVTVEHRVPLQDGEHILDVVKVPIRAADGTVTGVCGIARDVTGRRRAELENARLSMAIEQAAEVVIICSADGVIQYANPALASITGHDPDEVLGRDARTLGVHPDEADRYGEIVRGLRQGERWSGRIRRLKKDGTPYLSEGTVSPVFDDHGTLTHFVSVCRDVTAEVEMENQLRQAHKMEAVGQLAGGIAHDFNNLLQVINGYTDLAMEEAGQDGSVAECLDHVLKAGERARDLVRQLLAFSRNEELHLRNIDLNSVIDGLLKMLGRLLGEHIALEFSPGTGVHPVIADTGQIEQLVMNLCVNARDAMPEGGTLRLATANRDLTDEIRRAHGIEGTAEWVEITVSDTGSGIPPDIRHRVFEPFFTTKEIGQGTGLGLATVYAITKRHGGFIDFASHEGSGTTFRIYLPASVGENELAADEDGSAAPGRVAGETILLAEDEELVRRLAHNILAGVGYNVIEVADGEEAIAVLDECGGRVDLLLLDVVMPVRNGRAVCEYARREFGNVPVVFMSGYSFDLLKGHLPEEEFALIRKPFTRDLLLRKVEEALHPDS